MLLFVLFARSPYGAGIKTRLAPCCDEPTRRRLQHAFVLDSLTTLRCAAQNMLGHIQFQVASAWPVIPPVGEITFSLPPWLDASQMTQQVGAAFGDRLSHVFQKAFATGYKVVIVIGSDTPLLPESLLGIAVDKLKHVPVVLGPAEDGGCYLIGLSSGFSRPERLFNDVDWGTSQVLAQMQARCVQAGYQSAILPTYFDIDRCEDLKRLAQGLIGLHDPVWSATRQLLYELGWLDSAAKLPSRGGYQLRAIESIG